MVVLGDTPEELEQNKRAVKQQIAFNASTRTYQAVLTVHGLDHLVPRLHSKNLAGDWKGMADLISDEALDYFAVTVTWETLGAKLRERYERICDRTQLYPYFRPRSTRASPRPGQRAQWLTPSPYPLPQWGRGMNEGLFLLETVVSIPLRSGESGAAARRGLRRSGRRD